MHKDDVSLFELEIITNKKKYVCFINFKEKSMDLCRKTDLQGLFHLFFSSLFYVMMLSMEMIQMHIKTVICDIDGT